MSPAWLGSDLRLSVAMHARSTEIVPCPAVSKDRWKWQCRHRTIWSLYKVRVHGANAPASIRRRQQTSQSWKFSFQCRL